MLRKRRTYFEQRRSAEYDKPNTPRSNASLQRLSGPSVLRRPRTVAARGQARKTKTNAQPNQEPRRLRQRLLGCIMLRRLQQESTNSRSSGEETCIKLWHSSRSPVPSLPATPSAAGRVHARGLARQAHSLSISKAMRPARCWSPTGCSSGPASAGHLGPVGGTWCIFANRAKAPCQVGPLSANVGPRI